MRDPEFFVNRHRSLWDCFSEFEWALAVWGARSSCWPATIHAYAILHWAVEKRGVVDVLAVEEWKVRRPEGWFGSDQVESQLMALRASDFAQTCGRCMLKS